MKSYSEFDLVLEHTDAKGKGIFANEDIPANRRIFTHLVMPIPKEELDMFENSFLRYHLLYWRTTFAVGLGYVIYLNHSDKPNVKLVRHFEDDTIEAFSMIFIPKGTELTHHYANPQRHPSIAG